MGSIEKIIAKDVKVKKTKDSLYLNPNWAFSYSNKGISNFVITAVRGIGKSVISVESAIILKRKYGYDNVKCYYFRATDLSVKAMLANHGQKAIDPYLVRKYKLQISTKGNIVYDHGKPLIEFYPLVSATSIGKGVNLYDYNFFEDYYKDGKKRFVVTIWDEFMLDEGLGKKTVGDPVGQYRIYREAILRDAQRMPYNCNINWFLANNCSEIASVTGQLFNYIPNPTNFKPTKLTRKHTVFWNVPVTKKYIDFRKSSLNADIMDYNNDPNYTNVIRDLTLIKPKKTKIHKPTLLIKFSESSSDWFCIYDGKYIKLYNGETIPKSNIIPMRRHLNEIYNKEAIQGLMDAYDTKSFMYYNILAMSSYSYQMKLLKK